MPWAITESTFPSIVDAADGTLFTWLPLRLIVTERFDAASRIRSARVPKLILHGEADTMIPVRLARRLRRRRRSENSLRSSRAAITRALLKSTLPRILLR